MRALLVMLFLGLPGAAAADYAPVSDRSAFVGLVQGRELAVPFFGIRLVVEPDGRIGGLARGREVRGEWDWRDGYFCRTLAWGQQSFSYNCQAVETDGRRVKFTSDRGAGEHAVLTLR